MRIVNMKKKFSSLNRKNRLSEGFLASDNLEITHDSIWSDVDPIGTDRHNMSIPGHLPKQPCYLKQPN
jgi:hypothetical protein